MSVLAPYEALLTDRPSGRRLSSSKRVVPTYVSFSQMMEIEGCPASCAMVCGRGREVDHTQQVQQQCAGCDWVCPQSWPLRQADQQHTAQCACMHACEHRWQGRPVLWQHSFDLATVEASAPHLQ